LYREANRASISEQATKDRDSRGDPPSKQIGYFQSAEKRAWEGLSDDEKAHWENEASNDAPPPEQSYTSPHVLRCVVSHVITCVRGLTCTFRNQKLFVRAMTKILRNVIGFDKDQIGLASFNLIYGFRGEGGVVEPGW
jgi:hypothetical protein